VAYQNKCFGHRGLLKQIRRGGTVEAKRVRREMWQDKITAGCRPPPNPSSRPPAFDPSPLPTGPPPPSQSAPATAFAFSAADGSACRIAASAAMISSNVGLRLAVGGWWRFVGCWVNSGCQPLVVAVRGGMQLARAPKPARFPTFFMASSPTQTRSPWPT
jgi:hypothetical protein